MQHRLRLLAVIACLLAARLAPGQVPTASPRFPELVPQIGLRFPHCLAISPGGNWMAVVGGDVFSGATLELIDLKDQFVLRDSPVDGFPCPLYASPDGRWLAMPGAKSGTIILDVQQWRQAAAFPFKAVAFSPDSRLLVLDDGKNARLDFAAIPGWTLAPAPAIRFLDSDAADGLPLTAFGSNSSTLLAVQRDCSAPVWPCRSAVRVVAVPLNGDSPPPSVASDLHLVCGIVMDPSRDDFLLWGDVWQGKAAAELRRTADLGLAWRGSIRAVTGGEECRIPPVLGPAGSWIAAPYLDEEQAGTALVRPPRASSLDLPNQLALSAWPGHDGALLAQIHPLSMMTTLLGLTPDNSAPRPLLEDNGQVTAAVFSPDGAWLATGNLAGGTPDFRIWDLASSGAVRALPVPPGANFSFFVSDANTVALLHPGTSPLLRSLAGQADRALPAHFTPLAISPGGDSAIGTVPGGAEGSVRLAIISGSGSIHEVGSDRPAASVGGLIAIANRARRYVLIPRVGRGSSFRDGTIAEIYNADGVLERRLPPRLTPNIISLSPDGRWLVVQYLLTGEVWDLDSPSPRPHFQFNAWASPAAISPDNRLLLAPPGRLLDLGSGKLAATFSGMSNAPAIFSPDGQWVLTLDSGGMNLWSVPERRLRATLQTFADGSWLVATPEGLFDASPDALAHARWRFSDRLRDIAPLEIFLNEYYHPGLLPEIIHGGHPMPAVAIAARDRRQPSIGLALASGDAAAPQPRTVQIRLSLAPAPPGLDQISGKTYAQPSGLRDVRLFRNGTLIREWHGEQSGRSLEAAVTLTAGPNQLSAYAFSDSGIKSEDAALRLEGRPALARRGSAYILAIGINHYGAAAQLPTLRFAVADANDAARTLAASLRALGSDRSVKATILQDSAATRAGIAAAFRSLAARVQPEDTVIVYYAGHGVSRGDRFYLLPADLDRAAFEAGRFAQSRAVSDRDLEAWLEPVGAAHLLLVLDACDSGAAIGPAAQRIGPLNSTGLGELAFEKGLDILAASQATQSANENSRLGHGLLTYAMLQEGIQQGKAAVASRVEVRHWLQYTASEVPLLTKQILQQRAQTRGFPGDIAAAAAPLQFPRYYFRREPDVMPFLFAPLSTTGH